MRADFGNAVLLAATEILKTETGLRVQCGHASIEADPCTRQAVTAILAIQSDGIAGAITVSMSERTAVKMIQRIRKQQCEALDDLAMSYIAELANTIAGRAAAALATTGEPVWITPPEVTMGPGAPIKLAAAPRVTVPLHLPIGAVELQILVEERAATRGVVARAQTTDK